MIAEIILFFIPWYFLWYLFDWVLGPLWKKLNLKESHQSSSFDELTHLQAFTVKSDEVLVLIAPDNISIEEVERWTNMVPALAGRVVVVSGMGARRGK